MVLCMSSVSDIALEEFSLTVFFYNCLLKYSFVRSVQLSCLTTALFIVITWLKPTFNTHREELTLDFKTLKSSVDDPFNICKVPVGTKPAQMILFPPPLPLTVCDRCLPWHTVFGFNQILHNDQRGLIGLIVPTYPVNSSRQKHYGYSLFIAPKSDHKTHQTQNALCFPLLLFSHDSTGFCIGFTHWNLNIKKQKRSNYAGQCTDI